jgi:hypothetical protein
MKKAEIKNVKPLLQQNVSSSSGVTVSGFTLGGVSRHSLSI